MTTALARHIGYAPPEPVGMARSLAMAIFIHFLLLVALTWGISWNHRSEILAVEAELWSALPQQAAPKAVEPAPAPALAPTPAPVVVTAAPPPPAPKVNDAQIAVEREKKLAAKKKVDEEQARKRELKERELADKKQKLLERERALQQQRKESAEKQRAEAEQTKKQEAERSENIKRMLGQASSQTATPGGTAARSSGPSASYAGRIRARIKPNIVYADDGPGNPVAEVELRLAPDGTIIGRKLLKPSGQSAWDEAVLKAIDKTETLPRDVDGQVPSLMVIVFRPKE